MGKPSGLARRAGSANYYFRQRCPKRLTKPGVPVEVWISLHTASYREALERLDDARSEALRRFRNDGAPERGAIYSRSLGAAWPVDPQRPRLSRELAAPLARAFFRKLMDALDIEPLVLEMDRTSTRQELEDRYAVLTQPGERDEVRGEQIWVLNEAKLRGDYLDPACVALRNYLQRALAQLTALRLARLDGDYRDQITDALFQSSDPVPQTTKPEALMALTSTPLNPDLLDHWAKERGVAAKGVDKHRAVIRWFIERGGPPSAEAITRKHVIEFKDTMIDEGVTAANANAKLSCLRTLLGFAADNGSIELNPAAGISVRDKDKDRRKREEFSLAALEAIFSSAVYAAGLRPTQGRGEAAFWIPLIALFTGARLEEIAQLRPQDIRRERYVGETDEQYDAWVIDIAKTDQTATKNASSDRRVPLHPELEKLGLVRYAERMKGAGHERLFPDLRPNKYGQLGAKWGEWWSGYKRDACGVADAGMVFHSFRHTFKQYARHVGMVEGVQRQIMGHSPGDTADGYGASRYSLHQLVQGMRQYRIPGFIPPASAADVS